MDKPKLRQKPLPAVSEAGAARFLETARRDPAGLMFVFWLYTGLRPPESLGVRWVDIELAGEGETAYGLLRVRQGIVRLEGGKLESVTFGGRLHRAGTQRKRASNVTGVK